VEVLEASGGQLGPTSRTVDILRVDFSRANPTTGPVHVEGAQPGDALRITYEGFEPSGWGWTAVLPGFGLLAEDFPDPALHTCEYTRAGGVDFAGVARVPVRPFTGTIGLAPAEPGLHSVIPPRRVGGNLDTRDLVEGATLWLPVEVEGALLSIGDTHAAQGDGEVCGTAIESPMAVTVRVDLEKGAAPPAPRFVTSGPPTRHVDEAGYLACTGVGPDLLGCARDAVRALLELLDRDHGIDPVIGYMLCSVAADLRITEIVDAPNWVVACYLPRAVLR
jgi:acetamidase/formamidase